MKEIELLEKLVEVQEMHIQLMNDYNNLKLSFEAYKEVKIGKINSLQNEIEQQKENYETAIDVNIGLNQQIKDLKSQIEELQKSIISVETPEENQ